MKNKERARKAAETRRRNREANEKSKVYWEDPAPEVAPTTVNRTYSKPTITALIEDNSKCIETLEHHVNDHATALWKYIYKLEEWIKQLEARLG